MSRLLSLFLTGDTREVDTILPLFRRVIEGEGLDVVAVKEILRQHLPRFEVGLLPDQQHLFFGSIDLHVSNLYMCCCSL